MTWAELKSRSSDVTAYAAEHVLGWTRCTHDDCEGCDCTIMRGLGGEWFSRDPESAEEWEPFGNASDDFRVLVKVNWSPADRRQWGEHLDRLLGHVGATLPLILNYQPGMYTAAAALTKGFAK